LGYEGTLGAPRWEPNDRDRTRLRSLGSQRGALRINFVYWVPRKSQRDFEYLTILLQRWYSDWYYHVDRAHPVIFPSRAKVRVRIRLKRRSRLTERGRLLWIHRPWIRVLFCCCFIFVE